MGSENNQLFLNIFCVSGTVLGSSHILSSSVLTPIRHFYPQFRNEDTEACPGVIAQFLCFSLHCSLLVTLPASCPVIDPNPTLHTQKKKKEEERLEGLRQSTLTRSELPSSLHQKFVGHVCRVIYVGKRVAKM